MPQFTRPAFWKNNISDPYYERNPEALKVLRSVLSRIVVRHSKEQTIDGKALVSLPPRTVHTELLSFGSEAERNVYETLENRNLQYFRTLRRESPTTVLSKFIELLGMTYSLRQACSHTSLIDLEKVDNLNRCVSGDDSKPKAQHTSGNKTRAAVLQQAVSKARPSARARVRQVVMQFQEGEIELLECPVCFDPIGEAEVVITPCAHIFCHECILNILQGGTSTRVARGPCPHCRDTVKRSELTFLGDATEAGKPAVDDGNKTEDCSREKGREVQGELNGFKIAIKEEYVKITANSTTPRVGAKPLTEQERRKQRAYMSTLTPDFLDCCEKAGTMIGTKVSHLLEEINTIISKNNTSKCVVFSQFLGVLDIAAREMQARGIQFVRVDGGMPQHARADALLDFSSDPNVRVFLLSMRAGAVGLNLTAADHCFIMDIQQNAAAEEQAIDRIHRIGQTRPVTVKRFVMKGTVEERIMSVRRNMLSGGATVDGAGLLAEEQSLVEGGAYKRPAKRARREDEEGMCGRRYDRLRNLEILFGYDAEKHGGNTPVVRA